MNTLPRGFRVAGCHCGLKTSEQEDMALFVCDDVSVAAGVYTQNQVVAAPVLLDRERTPNENTRAVLVNAGNANACTGELGMQNARQMLELTATALGIDPTQVLVMSTGIIGEQLPMDRIARGINETAHQLAASDEALQAAARAIMTTDTRPKVATAVTPNQPAWQITGVAKGSGMIGPKMATMLAVLMTDAPLQPNDAQRVLTRAVQGSFNAINVDGHTSTNDTVLLLASGQGKPLAGSGLDRFAEQLDGLCIDLAKRIVDDGEGATHLIELSITGADSDHDARVIAATIANSPLVKTAIAGNDPNWGRIVSAAGYAGPRLDTEAMCLTLNGTCIFQQGTPLKFDDAALSKSLASQRQVLVELQVGRGPGKAKFWTCDLTHGYVTINADYHT